MMIKEARAAMALSPLEVEVLLAHILKKDRSWILAQEDYALTMAQQEELQAASKRRKNGEPVAYIVGEKEFYGRSCSVDRRVLIPRPSTEGLILLVLDTLKGEKTEKTIRSVDTDIVAVARTRGDMSTVDTVVDVGTGSGCIAVTLACECPHLHIIATDCSGGAITVAKENAHKHRVAGRIDFREGSDMQPLADLCEPFLLVSNPPYIPETEELERDVFSFEPHEALFGGTDGTVMLRTIITQAAAHPWCRGIVMECKEEQASLLLHELQAW
jgi:release factor glutamine methyltransferase